VPSAAPDDRLGGDAHAAAITRSIATGMKMRAADHEIQSAGFSARCR